MLGGLIGNGVTSSSKYVGGYSYAARSTAYVVSSNTSLTEHGTTPPRVSILGQNTSTTAATIQIEITTAGYPGGKDAYGVAAGTTARYRWTINGGGLWHGPVDMPPAWDPYNDGLSQQALGNGLTVVFTPGHYLIDNYWTADASPCPRSFCRVGSDDGTLSVLSWGHTVPGDPGTDVAGFDFAWNATLMKWQFRWASSAFFQHADLTGTALPLPGKMTFNDGHYIGTEGTGYSRLNAASADEVLGSTDWQVTAGILSGQVGWYPAGSVVTNKSDTVRRPGAWRATRNGGWGYTVGGSSAFVPSFTYRPGESIEANGYVYRALTRGAANGSDLTATWTTTPGTQFTEAGVTWECYGAVGGLEPIDIQSEVLGTYDASTGTATMSLEACSYERLKITGAPVGAFSLTMPGCSDAGGWVRVIWNTSGQACTVKGSGGDAGIAVPTGKAWQILSDGTNCVRVE